METPRGVVNLNILKKITNFTKKPETFLGVQENVAKELTSVLKSVYDHTKTAEPNQNKSEALPELIIQDFDEEQIWQELELQNDFTVNAILSDVARLVAQKDKLALLLVSDTEEEEEESNDDEWESENSGEDAEINGNDDVSDEDNQKSSPSSKINETRAKEQSPNVKINKTKQKKPSIVDDKFFKLDELNSFLEQEDRKDAATDKDLNESDDELDYEIIDHFQDIPEDDKRPPKYSDFFAAPDDDKDLVNTDANNFDWDDEGGDDIAERDDIEEDYDDDMDVDGEEDEGSESEGLANKKKRVRFDLDDEKGDDENDQREYPESKPNETKSHFEICQDRLKNKIGYLESAAMSEKPWQLKGEVSSTSRPQNSLLEEVVDFQMTTRPAPIITEVTTLSIEDMIKKRIKEKKWDDVKRQIKTAPVTKTFHKTLVLNEEKSKQSLAEIYEQDYKAKLTSEQEETIEHNVEREDFKEIRKQMASLFAKLDALANYHFMPKPAAPELRIITNIPAINMEEVAPVATTSANLLAPEEVKAKQKGDLMSKEERTTTDKKRERRHKKLMQHHIAKGEAKKSSLFEDAVPGFAGKLNKKKQEKLLKDVTKSKNVSEMKVVNGAKVTKSSTSFFSKLQDKVSTKEVKTVDYVEEKKKRKKKRT